MIAINSIGTYLSPEDRLTLCPHLGRLCPHGQALLSKADDYEQIRAVSEHFSVSIGQCYFSCDFLVIVIVKVIIFQVFQLQFQLQLFFSVTITVNRFFSYSYSYFE